MKKVVLVAGLSLFSTVCFARATKTTPCYADTRMEWRHDNNNGGCVLIKWDRYRCGLDVSYGEGQTISHSSDQLFCDGNEQRKGLR